jgi:prophage regulatory protein
MTIRFIRISEVIQTTGKSRSAIYADIAIGCFPKSIPIGARSVAWVESDIAAWVKAKIDAAKPKSKKEREWDEYRKQAIKEYAAKKPYELRAEDI